VWVSLSVSILRVCCRFSLLGLCVCVCMVGERAHTHKNTALQTRSQTGQINLNIFTRSTHHKWKCACFYVLCSAVLPQSIVVSNEIIAQLYFEFRHSIISLPPRTILYGGPRKRPRGRRNKWLSQAGGLWHCNLNFCFNSSLTLLDFLCKTL
jgi:hypothetical protein